MRKPLFYFFIMGLVFANSSCKVSRSIKQPYTSFFVDNNVNLYFIKPLAFTGPQSNVYIDFTFKDNQATDTLSATCNYTVEATPSNLKKGLLLRSDSTHHLYLPAVLFTEMKGSKQVIRYTSKISLASLMHILHSPSLDCVLSSKDSVQEVCKMTSNSEKQFKRTKNALVPTLDLKIQ